MNKSEEPSINCESYFYSSDQILLYIAVHVVEFLHFTTSRGSLLIFVGYQK